ncbi:MAG TPA: hypothetical protein PLO69_01990 [Gammaproteobacteria bacterium]|nr:hypothetical protein [Gammaproteobacteria bacterium]
MAANWFLQSALDARGGYVDNPRMASLNSNKEPTSVFAAIPTLSLGAEAEQWSVLASGGVSINRYPEASELNQNNTNFNLFSQYITPRFSWQLNGNYVQSSILSTTQPLGSQTALVQTQSQVSTATASPTVTWQISDVDQLTLGYAFQDVSYQNATQLGLFGFRYQQGTVTYTRLLNDSLQLFVTPTYSVFDVPRTQFQSKTASLQVGAREVFSPTLSATVAVGGRRTQSSGVQQAGFYFFGRFIPIGQPVNVSSLSTGLVLDAKIDKRLERGNLRGHLSRSLTPNGLGTQVQTDTADLNFDHRITERLSGQASLSLLRARVLQGTVANSSDRDSAQVTAGLSWAWSPRIDMGLNYSYTWIRQKAPEAIGAGNAIYLTLSYRSTKIPLLQ